jgi:hypothetical protein
VAKKSPFGPNMLGVDLQIDGAWTPITEDVDREGVHVSHGSQGESFETDVSQIEFKVRNGDGKYSPRNPSSPLFGKLGRNTPARVRAAAGAPWLEIGPNGYSGAADSASLSTTGDIDIRWWGDFALTDETDTLIWKADIPGSRSWSLVADSNGRLVLWWYPDGTTSKWAQSDGLIPDWAGEIALRATLDVDNGSGGWTANFYWAPNLDGPWLSLGTVTGAGVTNTFDGTSSVRLRGGFVTTQTQRVYGFEVRHGIDAPPVSSYRFERAVPGFDRATSVSRSNLFYDPVPEAPAGAWSAGANGSVGVVDDPEHGKVIETVKLSTAQAAPSMSGHHWLLTPNQAHKMHFDVLFEGGGSAGSVNLYYRPNGASSTTGQVLVADNLQAYTNDWARVEASFTTTSTTPASNAALVVVIPSGYSVGTRVLMRQTILCIASYTDLSVFSGNTPNSEDWFYYWVGGVPFAGPSSVYAGVPATTYSDDQGRRYGLNSAAVTRSHTLAVGEVAEWPTGWNRRGAPSVLTSVQASGVRRRLGQGSDALKSAMFRQFSQPLSSVLGYWPMEDGSDAEALGAALGNRPMRISAAVTPAAYSGLRGSAPVPTLGTGTTYAEVAPYSITGGWQVRWLQWTPNPVPANDTKLMRVTLVGGTIGTVDVAANTAGNIYMFFYDHEDVLIDVIGSSGSEVLNGTTRRVSLGMAQSGTSVGWRWSILQPFATSGWTLNGLLANQTLGRIRGVRFNPGMRDLGGIAVGHLLVQKELTSTWDVDANVLIGYTGENSSRRINRLADQNGVKLVRHGPWAGVDMGEEEEQTLLELFAEAAQADGGILSDDPESLGLRYRSLGSMLDQPALVVPYQDNLVSPMLPVDDDAMTRNRITVSRPNGTEFTAARESGSMSVLPPPLGVGGYDESLTVNVATDDLAERTAWWRLHTGTWDSERYPSLGFDLADPRLLADPVLTRELLHARLGDRLVITDPPAWLPPRPIDVIITGVDYVVTPLSFRVVFSCVPARPYRVARWNQAHRWSGSGTVTAGALSSSATSFTVTPPAGIVWGHPDGDYDIVIGGEVMTVTGVSGNTFTVVRSVNGVVKTHAAGAAVELASPSFYNR